MSDGERLHEVFLGGARVRRAWIPSLCSEGAKFARPLNDLGNIHTPASQEPYQLVKVVDLGWADPLDDERGLQCFSAAC